MKALVHIIDMINEAIGRTVSWLTLAMVVLMCANVVQRYLFQSNHIWQQELIQMMHALVFLLAAGYTLKHDGHVRVDVWYERRSLRTKMLVNRLGTVLFLFPVSIALAWFAYDFIMSSWQIQERSRELDGLQGIYLMKTAIWLFCGTLLLQGIRVLVKPYR